LLIQDLRPQDSIPFLKRVSAELHRSDVARQLSGFDLVHSDSPMTDAIAQTPDDHFKVPLPKRSSGPPPDHVNDGEARQHHAFVKTSFSKCEYFRSMSVALSILHYCIAVICRVCQTPVKHRAVLCQDCSLIAHSRCAADAPATCDIRAQLLLYAQYTHEGIPPPPTPTAGPPEVTPSTSPQVHADSPLSSSPSGPFKMFRKKSKQTIDSLPSQSSTPTTVPLPPDEEGRKRNLFFGRGRTSDDRSRSRASLNSSGTPNSSSLRSAGDKLEHPLGNGILNRPPQPSTPPEPKSKSNKHVVMTDVESQRGARPPSISFDTGNTSLERPLSPDDPSYERRRRRLSKSDSQTSASNKKGCLVQ
jgi:hypothetical protein